MSMIALNSLEWIWDGCPAASRALRRNWHGTVMGRPSRAAKPHKHYSTSCRHVED